MYSFTNTKNRSFKVRPLKTRKIIGKRKLWQTWVPPLFLLFGIISGSFFEQINRLNGQAYLSYFINQVLENYTNSPISIVSFTFLSSFILHFIILVFSFSCLGTPILISIPFLKGFYFGCVSGYLYTTLGVNGILINLLILLLPQFIESILICVLSTHAMYISCALYNNLLLKKSDTPIRTQEYFKVFLFTSILLIISSSICAILSYIFVPIFF